jgi:uncharacterized protein
MRNLTAILCLTIALLLGGAGEGWSADFKKGVAAYESGDYATALREWNPLAEQGDAGAQFSLGWMYYKGQGIPLDDKTAVKWYRLAAEQGHADAQNNLGDMYHEGNGVPQDNKTAVKWWKLAAEQGHAGAQNNLTARGSGITTKGGVISNQELRCKDEKGNSYVTLQETCEGEDQAENNSTVRGSDITTTPSSGDFQKGFDAYKIEDFATALREWKPLAEQGDAGVARWMGRMYRLGQGVPQDYKTAVKWYTLAAEQGYVFAQYILGEIYHYGTDILGEIYHYGTGVPRNYETAVKWYTLAAEQGNFDAQYILGELYHDGTGVPRNYETAVKWYRRAAEQGHAESQYNLGTMYRKGLGVPQDYKTAERWYTQAAKQGVTKNGQRLDAAKKGFGWETPLGLIPPECFVTEWMSSDNFEEIEDKFKINNKRKFRRNPGLFLGKKIPNLDGIVPRLVVPLYLCFEGSENPRNINVKFNKNFNEVLRKDCNENTCDESSYSILTNIPLNKCQNLAPNLKGQCRQSFLLKVGDYSGGSIGWQYSYNIYGLFVLTDQKSFIIPLEMRLSDEEVLNYVYGIDGTYKDGEKSNTKKRGMAKSDADLYCYDDVTKERYSLPCYEPEHIRNDIEKR